MIFDKIYYINRRSRIDRHKAMKNRLAELGLVAERFEALEGGHFDRRQFNFGEQKKSLNNGEIGCILSHRKIYELVSKENYKAVLILEDDALFMEGFKEVVELLNLSSFDMIYLGQRNYDSIENAQKPIGRTISLKEKVNQLLEYGLYKAERCWLTHAYIINSESAKVLLEKTSVFYSSLDGILADAQSELKTFAIYPNIVKQDGSMSDLR